MITFEQTLQQQNNLDQLCCDKKLHTRERFRHNAFYGIDRIIKKYVNFPVFYPLKFIVPHGILFSDVYVLPQEEQSSLRTIFCYPEYREKPYKTKTNKYIFQAASPFLYLLEIMKNYQIPRQREGTIFFPSHSIIGVSRKTDLDGLAQKISQLDDKYKPVTVCIFWKDYQLGFHKPFKEKGMKIVSAGHMNDPAFLYRFFYLCSQHKYSAANEIGSCLFYSAVSGCNFFFIKEYESEFIGDESILRDHTLKYDNNFIERTQYLESLFPYPPEETLNNQQKEVVDYYMGAKYLARTNQLRLQILRAEILYRLSMLKIL